MSESLVAATSSGPDASGGKHRGKTSAAQQPGHRLDIQGLRAVAVCLVVVYHLYPRLLPGGYVGVDVFFVISGFLITDLLRRELEKSGRVRIARFYARRARRLLPAAVLVLTVTWFASRVILPVTQLPATADQIRASALYFQNWVLANNSVDYLKADEAATPVQHFWSLSVEEQFYLVWPALFVLAAVLTFAARRRLAVLAALGTVVVVASFWFSVHLVDSGTPSAYFHTGTRIWELGAGGLLALTPPRIVQRIARIGPLGVLGLAGMVVTALVIDGGTPFPGRVALVPVVAALMVLAAGSAGPRFFASRLLGTRPLVFLGDLSYAIYLWHWPLVVLWKVKTDNGIGALDGPAIAIASVLLAMATRWLIEDPIRWSTKLVRSTPLSLATALVTVIPVALSWTYLHGLPGESAVKIDAKHPGAAALADGTPVPTADAIPTLLQAASDFAVASNHECMTYTTDTGTKSCTFGDTTDPTLVVALVGDSHAAQWSSALDAIGKERHWKLVVETRSGCPWTTTMTQAHGDANPYTACADWGKQLRDDLLNTIRPDVVLVSNRYGIGIPGDVAANTKSATAVANGMASYWNDLIDHDIDVVAIRETPDPVGSIPDCLAEKDAASCGQKRGPAEPGPTALELATAASKGKVPLIDMNDLVCAKTYCSPIVGNVVVYRDSNHLTRTYTMTIKPYLERELTKLPAFSS